MIRDVIQLTESLAVLPSRSMAYNAGALVHGRTCLLIDPGPHPDEVDRAAAFAADAGATVAYLLLTHSHWDHILAPERLPGVPVAAHEAFAATLAGNAEGTLAMITRWEARFGYARPVPFALPPVDLALADGAVLDVGGLALTAVHIPGHAADQLALFEPESGALWAADTLSDMEIPFVSDSLGAYETTLARLAALPIRALVPGHGQPTTDQAAIRGRIDADRAYLDELRRAVEAVVRAGGSVEEAVAACAGMVFRAPAENGPYHRLNVESAYIALGGAADPDKVGWAQKGLVDE
jgi:glyoxylase-like metal-dependent hydrolase (beta-lactamase superfamily II)